jgi:hypothetical protein
LDFDQGLVGPWVIVERGFEFGGWDVAEVGVQAAGVVPVHPAQGGHLDVLGRLPGPNTYAVFVLPDEKPIATQWDTRPAQRMNGWTLLAQGQSEGCAGFKSGSCDVLIQDVNGAFLGPWF